MLKCPMSASSAVSLVLLHSSRTSSPLSLPQELRRLPRGSASVAVAVHQKERRNPDYPLPEKPWESQRARMPIAPWMQASHLHNASDFVDLQRGRGNTNKKDDAEDARRDKALTAKIKGGKKKYFMRRLAHRVAKLAEIDPARTREEGGEDVEGGEVEGYRRIRVTKETIEFNLPLGKVEAVDAKSTGAATGRVPWERSENPSIFRRTKKVLPVTMAERTLPKDVLERLRGQVRKMNKWVKGKKAGVTQEVVEEIRKTWMNSELAKVKLVEPLSRNMVRAMEIVEEKTGGLVIWIKKDTLVVYRGCTYPLGSEVTHTSCAVDFEVSTATTDFGNFENTSALESVFSSAESDEANLSSEEEQQQYLSKFIDVTGDRESTSETLFEREANRLLDGLGPRFTDWWMSKPLPVDADLLPEIVPNFNPPFRCCPPDVRPKLSDKELRYFRMLAKSLPTHFALGKNRKLQGLAAAIIKLWKKSPIAKIAVKRGIPNTNNGLMSSELKDLTGGTLILRNKFYIILYRGNDFITEGVVTSISKRETELGNLQLEEEERRQRAVESFQRNEEIHSENCNAGTISEFQTIQSSYDVLQDKNHNERIRLDAEKEKLMKELRKQEHQLSIMKLKLRASGEKLKKLYSMWSSPFGDRELLTEEERQKFRKIGIKMDEVLLLGRRGIYDGVIRSIHLHWKYRELVKVVTMQMIPSHIAQTANLLEAETGGILIAVEKLRHGHGIIIYRGKNYTQHTSIPINNLLTKREAFERSIELQRRGSLRFFADERARSISVLKCRIRKLEDRLKALNTREESAEAELARFSLYSPSGKACS